MNLQWSHQAAKSKISTIKLICFTPITQPVRSLHSQDNHLLAKPSVYTSIGRRALSYAAPQIWNAI